MAILYNRKRADILIRHQLQSIQHHFARINTVHFLILHDLQFQ
ncbi:hypothetical protein DW66_3590 [Pseudomonas putida]|nr:hypothetical protein DW66_3590 [Pseudomonas putida]